MRLHVGDRTHAGRALDCRDGDTVADLAPRDLFDAIRRSCDESDEHTDLAVDCPNPGRLHRFVGLLDGRPLRSRRRLLALVARSRGETAPQDDAIRDLRSRLADCTPATVDLEPLRRRVATAGEREAELRERAAALRGALSARRELGADAEETADELAEVTAHLADVETERIAAEQALAAAEERARDARDDRERRLRLADALANRRREARAELAERVASRVATAEETVPGPAEDPTTTRLAATRVGAIAAPVVLAVDRFSDATTAAEVLDASVIRV